MPASLTVQVRLGFSMGWRIWTPNEVGFYAKTLAHSYFILVILKAKFLKQRIWVVNYNLFMGIKRYFVFIEYLHFGKKSLEEGCFWKKITYTSLVARHARYTKDYFRRKVSVFYKIAIKSRTLSSNNEVKMRPMEWGYFQKLAIKKILPKLKPAHDRHYLYATNLVKKAKITKSVKISYNISSKMKIRKDLLNLRVRYLLNVVAMSEKKNFKLRRVVNKVITKRYLKLVNFIKTSKKKKKKLKKKSSKLKKKVFLKKLFTFKIKALSLKNKLRNVFGPIITKDKKILSKKKRKKVNFVNPKGIIDRGTITKYRGFSGKKALYSMLEEFRFDPVYVNDKFSVAGGPRKRLSRNLRRAFKAKFIKNVTNLIWFWEKVSRLITYYVHYYMLEKNSII